MKRIKKISNNFYTLMTMSLMVLFVSCYQDDYSENTEIGLQSEYMKYSGQELFAGLFFYQNKIADDVKPLRDGKIMIEKFIEKLNFDQAKDTHTKIKSVEESMSEMASFTTDFILKEDPGFFEKFEKVFKSGNLYAMNRMMHRSAKLINQSLSLSPNFKRATAIGRAIEEDEDLKNKLSTLDISKTEDRNQLNQIFDNVSKNLKIEEHDDPQALVFAGAVAIAYAIAGAVSIAVAVYSVYFKVAYWGGGGGEDCGADDPTTEDRPCDSVNNTPSIEQERFIAAINSTIQGN
ncbi:hypothetical protein J8281_17990 [Aquimarina sp. U1-2]|uniref:hypothetical protein n=1 Tax=Aquimarina sp. U1-2 TaxID=2823141 RepID=UPI001AECF379|nr:hypothetical protein [Aquimarina sp. U1-2]MBP2834093.1 hypothetical protein [Aquimarina sp. U1-2]